MNLIELIKHILMFAENSDTDAAFIEFSTRTESMLAKTYSKQIKEKGIYYPHLDLDDFKGFFLGWVFSKEKFNYLYKWYEKEILNGRIKDSDLAVTKYYYRIIRAGFYEWLAESEPGIRSGVQIVSLDKILLDDFVDPDVWLAENKIEDPYNPAEYFEFIDEHLPIIIQMLLELSADNRIPIWLCHIIRDEDLPAEDKKWLANVNGYSTEEVEEELCRYTILNIKSRRFAIRINDIATLMKETADTISQRVHRSRKLLEEMYQERYGLK